MNKNKLVILLIKRGTSLDQIIKQQEGILSEPIAGCMFFYKQSFSSTPKWVDKFFYNRLECSERLRTTSSAGVLIVTRNYEDETRVFAVCFGYGRNLLNPGCIEERFGLITTLNTVNPKELRSLDISRLDSNSLKNRIQSSRLAGVSDFDFDIEKSLLRQATGLSSDEAMGKTVSGSDSISISVEADIETINEVVDRCYEKYNSDEYREAFSWIDHIKPIRNGDLIGILDGLLLEKLYNDNEQNTWLAVPDIIDWDDISILKYNQNGVEHEDILMDSFRQEVLCEGVVTIPFLKRKSVYAYNANGDLRYKWTYYRCIYSEVEHDDKLFMLNAGNWYQVDSDYKTLVTNTYNSVPLSSLDLIEYNHSDEEEYNRTLAESSPSFCLMDRRMIPTGIPGNSIEFCDVYDRSRKLIHIKKYGGSQVLGHLFNQGFVSAQMLLDREFRANVNLRLPEGWGIPTDAFNPTGFEVVYCIISMKNNPRPQIPFFSMVVFHDLYRTLTGLGYAVSIKAVLNASTRS